MHAELTTDGGFGAFPALARPVVLDEKDLSPADGAEFARLVAAARDEAGASRPRAAKAVPDGRTYRINIEGNDAQRFSAADPSIPPAFAALMDFVKRHGHRSR
ncbi:protealysin inhibitor emfourin [Caballeronia sp. J97]|uniref:protealysin inhibitor emfourin n=1 Tax=Caballeronia sp. J97 TaxID=2805429 RepID=UPI002AB2818C|nr:protealysin inhibitor emfourin [Caballeronia sp. J97]